MVSKPPEKRNLGKSLLVYLGTATVFIELFNFLVDKYNLEGSVPDAFVILIFFGLPAALIHEWNYRKFSRKAIGMHTVNTLLAIGVIIYGYVNPDRLRPTELRLLKFRENQRELASSVRSIAILPFANLTGDPDQNFMTLGMQDELISQMGSLGAIRVISRQSTLAYADTPKNLHEIAGELKVDAIIEGSVLPARENDLKIQLRLIGDMPNELQLWSKSYEVKKEEILQLYADIIKSVSEEINLTLSPEKEDQLNRPKLVNPEAYEFYLRGKTNFSFLTPQTVGMAEENFEKSLEIDPKFAPAYAGLAGVWIARKQLNFPGYTPEETKSNYTEYIQKSFALDSTNADVWQMYSASLNYEFDWEGANKALDRCLELNPNFAEAHAFYGHLAMMQSDWEKAWAEIDQALELDPSNPLVNFFYNVMLIHSGQFEKARQVTKGDLGFFYYGMRNMRDSVIISLGNSPLLKTRPEVASEFEAAYARGGYEKAINWLADTLATLSVEEPINAAPITLLYQFAANKDKTAQWIERMYIRRDPNLPYWAIKHPSKPEWFFEEPRIQEVMKRINLWE